MSKVSKGPTELSSNEVYDYTCQICAERGEKEAVQFCMSCDMYMCQMCCDQHKKIPVAINHKVLGKEKFGEIYAVKGLFEKRLIPTLTTQYLAEKPDQWQNYLNCELFHVMNNPYSERMLYFIFKENRSMETSFLEIGIVEQEYRKIISKEANTFYTLSRDEACNKCKNIIYMIIPKTNKVIKFCFVHIKAFCAFELQAENQCHAITPFNNGLAIAVNLDIGFNLPSWKIEIVKHDGQPITEFYYDDDGKPLFDTPRSLASNNLQDILFVSNQSSFETGESSVLALDIKGRVIFKYAIPGCHHIEHGLTYDTEGNFYLTCDGKVVQIDKHGKKSRDLLQPNTGNHLETVCFNTKSQQLVVVDSTRKITYFKFV